MVEKEKLLSMQFELESDEKFTLGTKDDDIADTIIKFSEGDLGLNCEEPESFNEDINEELTNKIVQKIDEEGLALPGRFELSDVRLISFKTSQI